MLHESNTIIEASNTTYSIEENLVLALKEQDKKALKYVYESYSAALFGVIIRIVKDEAYAEEILHDIFLKIWDQIANYDSGKGRLFTWMMALTRNLSIDRLRTRRVSQAKKTDSLEVLVGTNEPQEEADTKADFIGVDTAIQLMDEDQRRVVNLVYLSGYTHSEASDELNIPLGTVKTRLRLGLKFLKKQLL